MRSIVGISLIDLTIANGPSDKITKGLRMPSIMESYHDGFVYEFQFSEVTLPELFLLVLRMLLKSLMLIKLGCTHCSSNCLRTNFSKNEGGYASRSLEFQSANAKYPPGPVSYTHLTLPTT